MICIYIYIGADSSFDEDDFEHISPPPVLKQPINPPPPSDPSPSPPNNPDNPDNPANPSDEPGNPSAAERVTKNETETETQKGYEDEERSVQIQRERGLVPLGPNQGSVYQFMFQLKQMWKELDAMRVKVVSIYHILLE